MVIETNVILSILLQPSIENSAFALQNDLFAPDITKIELINVLRKYHFFKGLPKIKTLEYYNEGLSLVSQFYDDEILLENAIEISFTLNYPIYDCIFLALAEKLNDTFVSNDKKLILKAKAIGFTALLFSDIEDLN
jgi:predicted nucleic acid-binding protein